MGFSTSQHRINIFSNLLIFNKLRFSEVSTIALPNFLLSNKGELIGESAGCSDAETNRTLALCPENAPAPLATRRKPDTLIRFC